MTTNSPPLKDLYSPNTTLLTIKYKNISLKAGLHNGQTDDFVEMATRDTILDLLRNGWTIKTLMDECRNVLDRVKTKVWYFSKEEFMCFFILLLLHDDDCETTSMNLGVNADDWIRRTWRLCE